MAQNAQNAQNAQIHAASEAATRKIGKENQAEAATSTGGGNGGNSKPPVKTGLADPGDDDHILLGWATNKGDDSLDEFHDDLGQAVAIGVEYSEYLDYLKMGLPEPFLLADLERAGVQIVRDLLESFDWPVGDSLDANEMAGATQVLGPLIEGRLNRGVSGSDANER